MYSGVYEDAEADAFLGDNGAEILLGPLRVQRGQSYLARRALLSFLDKRPSGSAEDETRVVQLAVCLETAVLLGECAVASQLVLLLEPAAACVADYSLVPIARLLGQAALLAGESAEAIAHFELALDVASRLGFRPEIAIAHLGLAQAKLATASARDRSEALEHLDIAIPEFRAMGMLPALERALAFLNVAESSHQRGVSSTAIIETDSARIVSGLTPRELEVVSLLAVGMTNGQIADRLVITRSTAEVHVKRILSKLGLKSRWQVAVWATERGLGPHLARKSPD
jgi:DNA-binding CsgD family transcriptional regulator